MNRSFTGFVVKEIRHVLRDRRTLVILLGMPAIMLMLFGSAIRTEIRETPVIVVDMARDQASRAIIDRFDASAYFTVVGIKAGEHGLERSFRSGRARMAVLISPDLERHLGRGERADIRLLADGTDPNTANTLLAYASAIVSGATTNAPAHGVHARVRMMYNPEMRSAHLFVPGLIAVVLMLICALMTSITITREKEMGTMEVLLVSPLRPLQIIAGKVVPYVGLSLMNLATILLLARLVFQVPIHGSLTLLLFECLLFILCALSLGILISSRATSLQAATMVALAGLLLPTVILSGFIFPIASMPAPLQVVSHIIPAKWFLEIVRGIMLKGSGLDILWPQTLVLAGMTATFLFVALRSFSERLER
jgi:ABC-2 type transport system permease protein